MQTTEAKNLKPGNTVLLGGGWDFKVCEATLNPECSGTRNGKPATFPATVTLQASRDDGRGFSCPPDQLLSFLP